MDAQGSSSNGGEVEVSEAMASMAITTSSDDVVGDDIEPQQDQVPVPESPVVTIDQQKEPTAVPSQPPVPQASTASHTDDRDLVNLTVVPTLDDSSGEPKVVGLPDLLPIASKENEKDSVIESASGTSDSKITESQEKVSDSSKSEACQSDNSGANVPQEGSVLPSMGILPESEEFLQKVPQPPVPQCSEVTLPSTSQPTAAAATLPSTSQSTDATLPSTSQTTDAPSPEPHPTDPSEVVHKIKKIKWGDIEVPIITQNNNGPCPLLAIVNVMLLKGQINLPSERTEITGGELVLMVGNALFDLPRKLSAEMKSHLEQNTEDAISKLPKLLTGLDVNVKFSGVRDFEFTGELCVFDLLGIMLYHGWVVDPSSEAAPIISHLSYNQLTNNIFAWREEAIKNNNNDLLVKAMLCEEFMASSGAQLTIHGLFELGSSLQHEEIAVFFRNNHFSTVYKRGDQLYQLLTDQGFLHENLVWETLNDVDATFSEFVNGAFQPITPAPEPTPAPDAAQSMTMQQQINSDQELAAMLQHEVDLQQRQQQSFERLKDSLGLHNLTDEEIAQKLQEEENRLAAEAEAEASRYPSAPQPQQRPSQNSPQHSQEEKKKKDCVIL